MPDQSRSELRKALCLFREAHAQHCVAYLAEAPKSTRSYTAYKRAEALANEAPLPGIPLQIRNAPTKLMKKLGYGKEYSYDPDYQHPVMNVSSGAVVREAMS